MIILRAKDLSNKSNMESYFWARIDFLKTEIADVR